MLKALPRSLPKRISASFLQSSLFSSQARPPLPNLVFDQTKKCIELQEKYVAKVYPMLPICLRSGKGVKVTDVDGNTYYDFNSANCSLNHGILHEKTIKTLHDQLTRMTVTQRSFYNQEHGKTCQYLSKVFGYEEALLLSGGAQAVETAFKIARRWGYQVKKIPENQARILFCNGNFMGRTLAMTGATDDMARCKNFGPWGMNFDLVDYDNLEKLQSTLKNNSNYAAFVAQPIQCEGFLRIPSRGYLAKVRQICTKYNVLMVTDEIQTGLGRSGKLLCHHWDNIRPDIVILGKALAGGIIPASGVLADNKFMKVLPRGVHGATFGGNALSNTMIRTAIKSLIEDGIVDNALKMGEVMKEVLQSDDIRKNKLVKEVRGWGMFSGVELKDSVDPWKVCLNFAKYGGLAKPNGQVVRLTPPLVITQSELRDGLQKFKWALESCE